MAELANQDAFDKALRSYEECSQHHNDLVAATERRYKTYRGILEATSEAAQWTSKAHPPYVLHIVETSLASMVEDRLRFRVRPKPTIDFILDPEAVERARQGARAHELLFNSQIIDDGFNWIQRPFIVQNSIAGLTVAKNYWVKREERRRQVVAVQEEVAPGVSVPRFETTTKSTVIYDGPTTEVRDVRDFIFPGNAVSLKAAAYVIDRVWKLPEEIWDGFQDGGAFGPSRGGWTEKQCRELIAESRDVSEEVVTRESVLFNIERSKGLVEVLEVWNRVDRTVTTIANRKALLSHRTDFPFFHEQYPFVVCSTHPDLFRIPGISQVEKIEHLQTLAWDIMNQSTDNLRLVNNAIAMFRPDVEDVDAYEFYPGARWLVEDPSQVEMWTPNPVPAEISLGREALIKGDMQNLAGGFPFSSGTDSQFVDQKTATGASLVSSIAQRGLDLQKREVYKAWEEAGQQRMVLNQQFIREPQVAPALGIDSEEEMQVIFPELLQGDYRFELEPMPNAMMKQEEQAASQALLQMALSAYPVAAMAAANGAAKPLNLDAFIEDLLKAHGKEDTQRYFSSKPPVALPQGQGGGAQQAPGAPVQGVTAPQSIDPAVSPSSQMSLSPVAALQRAQALDRS